MTKTFSHEGWPVNLNAEKKKRKTRAANENAGGMQIRIETGVPNLHQGAKKTDVMQCGHDRCRLWWASQGRFLWNSKHSDSPVDCVFSCLASASDFGPASYPPSFVPHQPAKVHLKTICPDKKKHTREHVLIVMGDASRQVTDEDITRKVEELNHEADKVVAWGTGEVKKRMLIAAARVNLKIKGRPVDTFEDLKTSWKDDGSDINIGKIYEICHGDYEGKRNQQWSRALEMEYMRQQNIEYEMEPSLREKGGYEMCITHAKGGAVRQIMARSENTHNGKIVLSLKGAEMPASGKLRRREEGDFYYKKNVSDAGCWTVVEG
jgi:hypothetical protein